MQETLVSRATDPPGADFARKITEEFEPPRKPGDKPETYTISCPRCKEKGTLRGSCGLKESCPLCDGARRIIMYGQRASDLRERQRQAAQPTWSDIIYWMICSAGLTAGLLYLLCWRYGLL